MSIFGRKRKAKKGKEKAMGRHKAEHGKHVKRDEPAKHEKKEEEKKEEKAGKVEEKPAGQVPEAKEAVKAGKKPLLRVKIIPKFYQKWIERQLYFSGSKKDPRKFAWTTLVISVIAALGAGWLFRPYMAYVAPLVFIMVVAFFDFVLILSVDRRARFVDEILPDALMLLSANIRAGYIPSRALILSARKEFGPLAEAIKRAGKEIMSGSSLDEGLKVIPGLIKSKDLKRTIDLIIQGIRGGGQLVALLEENALDIRRRQAMKREITANTMMYAIFIAFAGCLGAPGLYALSGYLTKTMSDLGPDVSMTSELSGKVSFMQLQGAQISPEFLFQFSIGQRCPIFRLLKILTW